METGKQCRVMKVYQVIPRSKPEVEAKEVNQETAILPFGSMFSHKSKTISHHIVTGKSSYLFH
jgi:hypothetical protein